MARIIKSDLAPWVDLVISTIYKNGNIANDVFREGDMIEDLRYVENGDIKIITGRLAKINAMMTANNRNYTAIDTARSYFSEDVIAMSINVDCSEKYNSNVVNVPVREILEFDPDGDEVERIDIKLRYGVHIDVGLSNGTTNSFDIYERNIYQEFTYLDFATGEDVTAEVKIVAFIYNGALNPSSVIFIQDGILKSISVLAIKNASKEIIATEANASLLNDAIECSETGIVSLTAGEISDTVFINRDITIIGVNPDVKVNSISYKGMNTGTIISGAIEIAKGVSVKLKGLTLTNDAYLNLTNGAAEVILENCIIKDVNPYQAKSFLCLTKGEKPIKLTIKGCYFGANASKDNYVFHNLFELTQKLATGSEISDNYFEEKVCANNIICIYDVEDDANIYICNNIFEYSANAIRIGTKGDARCNIFIDNNVYYKTTISNPEYAGLLLIQPYGAATTNMSNVIITLSGNKHNDRLQLYYMFSSGNDMRFDDDNKPKIIVS